MAALAQETAKLVGQETVKEGDLHKEAVAFLKKQIAEMRARHGNLTVSVQRANDPEMSMTFSTPDDVVHETAVTWVTDYHSRARAAQPKPGVKRPDIFLKLSAAGRAAAKAATEFRWVDSVDLHLAAKLLRHGALDFVGTADDVRAFDICVLLSNGVTSMKEFAVVLALFTAARERKPQLNYEEVVEWEGICITTCQQ